MSTLVGHQARWAALARAFNNNNIPQTLLISGPPEIGKWTLARRYAQLLLCTSPIADENNLPAPCGSCQACHQVEIETFPDFQAYRPLVSSADDERDWVIAPRMMQGSILTISVARKFASEAMKRPLCGPRKVMVLVQADRMNDEAQNCLLKTFEEPIPGLSIFLICDNVEHLRATIRSRSWHLPLSLASDEQIVRWLRESTAASSEQIALAVGAAGGRPGAARRAALRLQSEQEESTPRSMVASAMATRIEKARPVAALGLTLEALQLAKIWWEEDTKTTKPPAARGKADVKSELKKGDAKITRSAVARFLDELAAEYRARWQQSLANNEALLAARWAYGLDQIRKTRHYILRNANTNLALDVLFMRLIGT